LTSKTPRKYNTNFRRRRRCRSIGWVDTVVIVDVVGRFPGGWLALLGGTQKTKPPPFPPFSYTLCLILLVETNSLLSYLSTSIAFLTSLLSLLTRSITGLLWVLLGGP
jgi:hypothetical protein